jgi:hypothetical protein
MISQAAFYLQIIVISHTPPYVLHIPHIALKLITLNIKQ